MKKIFISTIAFIIIFLTSSITSVYATDKSGKSTTDDGSWVSKAFSAASTFMNEPTKDFKGILSPTFTLFQNIVKAINRILIVLLAGISTIALSVTGVRYLASGASPEQRDIAKQSLHTIFIGMAFGFGAFVIWRVAMAIVSIMIASFGRAG
jgi:hypothetical protein